MYLLQMCACDQVVLQELRVLPWALQEQLEEVPDQDGAVSDCDGHASSECNIECGLWVLYGWG
eukprot:CAMPEP_0202394624 /NCGR_PEP_ID=MMETSP1127-20130417/93534_1 /ASSEMBLY_ACC=CAM_ASM_000462 /TAXON_ID=3047 /ORGANISM="Dunaliella tertiolecta, Strain CCMP1320" /LENGTH=62 /DNA_ID=CAMNT_0048997269 /DNA_START=590 /DNA_END=778 /DNA_ORIENTATION=-